MGRMLEREPDPFPRWALVIDQYNNIYPVLLVALEREMAKGMGRVVLAREDHECMPRSGDEPFQSNPRRAEDEEC